MKTTDYDRPRQIERALGAAGRGEFTRIDGMELRTYIDKLEDDLTYYRREWRAEYGEEAPR